MDIIVIAHNIRSAHNIGAILRTADGFGIKKVICSGYSPYPVMPDDARLPHIYKKLTLEIAKTALGAEHSVGIELSTDVAATLLELKKAGYRIVGLEQHERSVALHEYVPHEKMVLLLGEEVAGIHVDLMELCDDLIEIPMHGVKESLNVSVATGIALFHLTKP